MCSDYEEKQSDPSTAIVLRLKRTQQAESGAGQFLTFTKSTSIGNSIGRRKQSNDSRKKKSPSPPSFPPASSETRLAARWLAAIGSTRFEESPLSLLGTWVKLVPSYVGSSKVLDLSITYILESMGEFRQGMEPEGTRACVTGQRSLRSLYAAIGDSDPDKMNMEVIMAVMLHYIAEVSDMEIRIIEHSDQSLMRFHSTFAGSQTSTMYHI